MTFDNRMFKIIKIFNLKKKKQMMYNYGTGTEYFLTDVAQVQCYLQRSNETRSAYKK